MGGVLQAGDESKRSLGSGGAVGPELGKNCVRVALDSEEAQYYLGQKGKFKSDR